MEVARHARKHSADDAAPRAWLAHRRVGQAQIHRGCRNRRSQMKAPAFNTTVLFYPNKNPKLRLFALWYFTVLLTIWNVLGHTVLGFEQSWASPVAGLATAIGMQFLLEWVDARAKNRELRFMGGFGALANFLPAAIIPGFACALLLFPQQHLWPILFSPPPSLPSSRLIPA